MQWTWFAFKMQYTDSDLTFYLVVYQDFERAVWCLNNLRKHYPVLRVVIDVDGDDDPDWASLRQSHDAEVHYGERLFLAQHGGALLKRMLSHQTVNPAATRWMFRIDTDTEIRRRFRYMSPHDYFGQYRPNHHFVQGGCIGVTRDACQRILDRGILDDPRLGEDHTIWFQGQQTVADRVQQHDVLSLDWMLNWAMSRVGLRGHSFPEVASRWKRPISDHHDCAVAHPCKVVPVSRAI